MTVTVAMYEGSYDHIGARLDALGLDINIITFDKDAQFTLDGKKVPASKSRLIIFGFPATCMPLVQPSRRLRW